MKNHITNVALALSATMSSLEIAIEEMDKANLDDFKVLGRKIFVEEGLEITIVDATNPKDNFSVQYYRTLVEEGLKIASVNLMQLIERVRELSRN